MLHSHPTPTDTGLPSVKGSIMLATAGSREEVLEVLKRDIYTREGVWDVEKVEIIPVGVNGRVEDKSNTDTTQFKSAVRKELT